ncbi:CobW family GTP-binding protein [Galenea microaerophila]
MSTLATNLITGLLGSGKTTTLHHLLQHKPENETWGVLINEFGEIEIDASLIQMRNPQVPLAEVHGGCICCTAQLGLVQGLQTLLKNTPNLDRLLIEPTGIGHPAQILDTLQQTPLPRSLQLQTQLCILDPRHLTPERWQKSTVMRDLVTLADLIVLNKTDLCTPQEVTQAKTHLQTLYPPKNNILETQQGQVPIDRLQAEHTTPPFLLLAGIDKHLASQQSLCEPHRDTNPHPAIWQRQIQQNSEQFVIGWQLSSHAQFNRNHLKNWLKALQAAGLQRAKGLVRTGIHSWQLLQATETEIAFQEIAWRQDSRITCIFNTESFSADTPETLETALLACIHRLQSTP